MTPIPTLIRQLRHYYEGQPMPVVVEKVADALERQQEVIEKTREALTVLLSWTEGAHEGIGMGVHQYPLEKAREALALIDKGETHGEPRI